MTDKRRIKESQAAPLREPAEDHRSELRAQLDREISGLPEKYRAVLILCELEGKGRREAAEQLHVPEGTVASRLSRARKLLARRLTRHGPVVSVATLAALTRETAANLSHPLMVATLGAAGAVASGQTVAGGLLSANVATLVGGVMKAYLFAKLKIGGFLIAATLLGALSVVALVRGLSYGDSQDKSFAQAKRLDPSQIDPLLERISKELAAVDQDSGQFLVGRAVFEAKRGNLELATKLLQRLLDMAPPGSDSHRASLFMAMATSVSQCGDRVAGKTLLAEALKLVMAIQDGEERNRFLREAAYLQARHIDADDALALARLIPDEADRQAIFAEIAVEQAKSSNIAGALRTADLVPASASLITREPWKTIAAAQLKSGRKMEAEASLAKGLALATSVPKQGPPLGADGLRIVKMDILTAYAIAQAETGDREAAKVTLQRAKTEIGTDDKSTGQGLLILLALAQARIGDKDAANKTLARVYKSIKSYSSSDESTTVLPVLYALKDYDRAMKVVRHFDKAWYPWSTLCEALAVDGFGDRALELALAAKTEDGRREALIATSRGIQSQIPIERLPKYSGSFLLIMPLNRAPSERNPWRRLDDLKTEYEKAMADLGERLATAKTEKARTLLQEERRKFTNQAAAELLDLARKFAGSQSAVEAFEWILKIAPETLIAEQAIELAHKDDVETKNIGNFCTSATYSIHVNATERLLRSVLEKSPHHADKGAACIGLADFLRHKANLIRRAKAPLARTGEPLGGELWYGGNEAPPCRRSGKAGGRGGETIRTGAQGIHRHCPTAVSAPPGDRAKSSLFELRNLALGKTAPGIEGKEIDGTPLKLSDYRGKVVVLTFWSTTSARSRALTAHQNELAKLHKYDPVVMLGINGDEDRTKLHGWLSDNPLSWKSWWDSANDRYDSPGPIAHTWNITAWPAVYVLDHRGVIRYRDVIGKELDDAIATLLKDLPSPR